MKNIILLGSRGVYIPLNIKTNMRKTVQFTDEEWDCYHSLCLHYAIKELESTKRQKNRRNQFNTNAMIHQTTTGKLAEWALTLYYLDKGEQISDPDMTIYNARGKSFDADLTLNNKDLHVKSQTVVSAKRFGTSWMFQFDGKGYGHKDPLLQYANGDVAFCIVDFTNKRVHIEGICNFQKIRHKLKKPVKNSLKNTKRCIKLVITRFTTME